MILRIYAMWNQSKIILSVLLLLYVLQTITAVVFYGMSNLSVTITQGLNTTFCSGVLYSPFSTWSIVILHLTFSLALFIFPVVQTISHTLDIRKTTKRWQPNQYIKILAADGIMYFFMHLCYDVRTLTVWRVVSLSAISVDFLNASSTLLLLTMLPRFIIGIRELYDRDVHRQQDIDSGFGLLSFVRVPDTTAFVDVGLVQEQIAGEDTEGFGSDPTDRG
ncbi:hypothetical protein JVU11DRAFT_2505 [Chiua virens]|nr:hypothetical protein JVU11DRAFT_2505 [Chiua virens]